MGYASMKQKGRGIHLRQFSRAVVIEEEGRHFVLASVECGMMGHGVRMEVRTQWLNGGLDYVIGRQLVYSYINK